MYGFSNINLAFVAVFLIFFLQQELHITKVGDVLKK